MYLYIYIHMCICIDIDQFFSYCHSLCYDQSLLATLRLLASASFAMGPGIHHWKPYEWRGWLARPQSLGSPKDEVKFYEGFSDLFSRGHDTLRWSFIRRMCTVLCFCGRSPFASSSCLFQDAWIGMMHPSDPSPSSVLSRSSRSGVLDSRRWHMLSIYVTLGILNQTLWLSFAATPDATAHRFDIDKRFVAYLAVLCNAVYVPGSWLCTWLLRSHGLAKVVTMACWLQLFGSFLRWFSDLVLRPLVPTLGFLGLFCGQGIAAVASPLIMNTPAVFADAWFGKREREGVLAAGALAPIFGQGLGSAVAGFIVSPDGQGTETLLAGQALLSLIVALWTINQFLDAPGTRIAANGSSARETFHLLCQPYFFLILLIFNCGMALAASTLTLFGDIASSCGYTSTEAGLASGLFMIGGVAGSLGTGSLLGATRAYQTILRCAILSAVIFGCLFLAMLRPENLAGLLITVTFFGTFMMSSLPALLSNAVEATFPTPPEISTTLLFNSAILLQVFFTPLAQSILNQDDGCPSWGSKYSTFNVFIGFFGCLLPAAFYCGKSNRLLAENQEETNRS